jgi:hypothetical protein
MHPLKQRSAAVGAIALVVLMFAPLAMAQDMNSNKKTYLTFSGPVEVPGATLEPGTYMFQLADVQSNRHIVQIFNQDGTKLIVTTLTIPDQRMEPTDKPQVKFLETSAGTPAAIRSWYYPGDVIGDEFIYPKDQAMRIARATNQTVLSSDTITGDGIPGMRAETTARINAEGQTVTEEAQTTRPAEQPAPPTPQPQAAPPPTPQPEAATPPSPPAPPVSSEPGTSAPAQRRQGAAVGTGGRSELPRTASSTPLVGLIGLLSLVAAASIGALARHRA